MKEHHLKTALVLVSIALGSFALILGLQLLWQLARLLLLGVGLWVAWGLIKRQAAPRRSANTRR